MLFLRNQCRFGDAILSRRNKQYKYLQVNICQLVHTSLSQINQIIMQVLLLGGHGKVALHLTPLLLNRAWNVTSVVRNPDHESEILALGKGLKGNLNVLISSLENVKSAADAQKIIDTVSPHYVVWSAGTNFPSPLIKIPHAQHVAPSFETN